MFKNTTWAHSHHVFVLHWWCPLGYHEKVIPTYTMAGQGGAIRVFSPKETTFALFSNVYVLGTGHRPKMSDWITFGPPHEIIKFCTPSFRANKFKHIAHIN